MPGDESKIIDERWKYLKLVAPRYVMAKRRGRSELLTEMAVVTWLHRKSPIWLMGMPSLERAPKRPRFRRRNYGAAVGAVVRVVRESLDYVCAERLTPVLLDTGRQLAEWEELVLTPEAESALSTISRSTVQRLLERFQVKGHPPRALIPAKPNC